MLACGYAANQERAEIGAMAMPPAAKAADAPAYQSVPRPTSERSSDVCEFLRVDEATSAKLLVFLADGKPVAALLRGDHGPTRPRSAGRSARRCSSRPTRPRSRRSPGHHGFPRSGRNQDPAGHRPGDHRDGNSRRRGQRGRYPLQGRGPGARLPAGQGSRPAQCRRG